MAISVSNSIIIERPCAEVFNYVADPDHVCEWYVNIRSVEWITTRPATEGTKIAFVAHFLGRRLSYTYEITVFQPEQRLTMRTAEGPFPMETRYLCEAVDNKRTRMTLENEGDPGGFFKIMAPMMRSAMNRANRKDLALLKNILEAR